MARFIQIEVPDDADLIEACNVVRDALTNFVDIRCGLYVTDESASKYVAKRYAGNPVLNTPEKAAEVKRRCLLARFMHQEITSERDKQF